jgi:hypothetical protein
MEDRLRYWWKQKPSSQRLLIKLGIGTSVFLLASGLFFDVVLGADSYNEYPFLTSIPKDLFKLVIIGTASVLLLDELRTSWRALPELRGRAPETAKVTGDVVDAALLAIGRTDMVPISRDLRDNPRPESISNPASKLLDVATLWRKLARETQAEDVSTGRGKEAWTKLGIPKWMEIANWEVPERSKWKVPEESDLGTLAKRTDDLLQKLSDIAPFVGATEREEVSELRARLADLPQFVEATQQELRLLLSHSHMKTEEMLSLGEALHEVGITMLGIENFLLGLRSQTRIDL